MSSHLTIAVAEARIAELHREAQAARRIARPARPRSGVRRSRPWIAVLARAWR